VRSSSEACGGARAQGQQGTLARALRAQPLLLLPLLAYATSTGSLATFSLASKSRASHKQGRQPLLVAMQRKGTRRGKSSAKAHKAQGGAQGGATFSFGSATHLMPAAHPPAKYLCLLLAMQRKGKRGGTRRGQGRQQGGGV
jgi:hypothetical protein